MRAAVTTEDHGFDIVDVADPSPGSDEVLIRVAACGVCGSDIKAQLYAPAGMIMGHELGGEIVAVGSSAGEWREGTNVAVLPVVSAVPAHTVRRVRYRTARKLAMSGWDRPAASPTSPSCPHATRLRCPPTCQQPIRPWLSPSPSDCMACTAPKSPPATTW